MGEIYTSRQNTSRNLIEALAEGASQSLLYLLLEHELLGHELFLDVLLVELVHRIQLQLRYPSIKSLLVGGDIGSPPSGLSGFCITLWRRFIRASRQARNLGLYTAEYHTCEESESRLPPSRLQN